MKDSTSSSQTSSDLKYVTIARVRDGSILLAFPTEKTKKAFAEEYRVEVQEIINSLKGSQVYPDLRESSETIQGTWYTLIDQNLLSYSVLVDNEFRTITAYQFLRELSKETYKELPRLSNDYDHISNLSQCKEALTRFANSYSDPRKADKLAHAQSKVDQVRLVMQKNVQDLIANQEDIHDMESKSDNIKGIAFTMKNQAKNLEREARKRNCRLCAIIIIVVIALLIAIIVPIATKFAN